MEKTFDLPKDESLESLISHWEKHLSNALTAANVARLALEKLYPQRYEIREVELGHTALQEIIDKTP